MLAAALVGLFVGIPALRMQSHYLGIVTLGLALAFTNWVTNSTLTGGADGISGIPVPPLFGIDLSNEYLYYYFELIVFGAGAGLRRVRRAAPGSAGGCGRCATTRSPRARSARRCRSCG